MRVRYYGPGWSLAKVRGTRQQHPMASRRAGHRCGAFGAGSTATRCSGTSARRRSGIAWCSIIPETSYPIGIMSRYWERFVDEGESFEITLAK